MTKQIEMTQQNLEKMTKAELIQIILDLSKTKTRKSGFTEQRVHQLLIEHQPISHSDLADLVPTTTNALSSYLNYLRKRGIQIGKNGQGQHIIID